MELQNLPKDLPNGENMGGLTQEIIFFKWDDVATWPAAVDTGDSATLEDYATITDNLVMTAGKRAFTMYVTEDTGSMNIAPVGEVDGKSFEVSVEIFHPGLKKKILGFMGAVKNDTLGLIVRDSEGQYVLLGDEKRGVMYDGGEAGTGKATADRKGFNLNFKYKCNSLKIYEGDVVNILSVSSS